LEQDLNQCKTNQNPTRAEKEKVHGLGRRNAKEKRISLAAVKAINKIVICRCSHRSDRGNWIRDCSIGVNQPEAHIGQSVPTVESPMGSHSTMSSGRIGGERKAHHEGGLVKIT
jgi:hypothetical protein